MIWWLAVGIFFGRRKPRPIATVEISAEIGNSYISDKDMKLLQSGLKRDMDGEIYPPDTVWVSPRSHVYHHMDYCRGCRISSGKPMPESKAIKLGLRACSKCDWDYTPFP